MRRYFQNSDELCQYVAGMSDSVILSFSCGKDSIGAWLQLKRYFKRIECFYMYLVPGLEFVEESLRYYEKVFGSKIIRAPHPSLYRMLNNLVFQSPENCHIIEEMGLEEFDYDDVAKMVKRKTGLPLSTFTAHGSRMVDSMMRRASLKKWGSLNPRRRSFWPIFDWRKEDLVRAIKEAKIKLPVDYVLFGRSFDGIDYRFLGPIKRHFPRDYKRILEFFPLAELEIFRYERR